MKKMASLDFAQKWASQDLPVEVRVRGLLMGTYLPGIFPEDVQLRIPASTFHRRFRHLRNKTIITTNGRPKGTWVPNPDFPLAVNPPREIPLDSSDPYSEAMVTIRQVLEWAHEHRAVMSEGEYLILSEFAKVMAEEDPYLLTPTVEAILTEARQLDKKFQASIH